MTRLAHRAATVAWPAFLGAGLFEMVVFAFVDPSSLHALDGTQIELSPMAVYSLAFLIFWALAAATCLLTLTLSSSADEVNRSSSDMR
jgi:hypothetical protein